MSKSYLIGKRIIVHWTLEAFNRGNDWPAFRVLDETEDGFWCQGVDSPCGAKHDGSKAFIRHDDYVDTTVWKEDK